MSTTSLASAQSRSEIDPPDSGCSHARGQEGQCRDCRRVREVAEGKNIYDNGRPLSFELAENIFWGLGERRKSPLATCNLPPRCASYPGGRRLRCGETQPVVEVSQFPLRQGHRPSIADNHSVRVDSVARAPLGDVGSDEGQRRLPPVAP